MNSVGHTVRSGYAALAARDDEGLIASLAHDVELQTLTGCYRGHDGIRQWLAQMDEGWDPWELTIKELKEVGDRVLIELALIARSTLNGITMSETYWVVWELQDGRPALGTHYADHEQALRAVQAPGRLEP